ncbi:Protein CBG10727 [Caenorhabditis briggsae]|uniref:Protein CBG10727 n=1 Tax=Caenorhabditis briggsae TaxID=6238 RepID=A8XBN1_CAEBR|nr:Protein CBG10727 [Caenorhabditis briggsae]CAP30047.1 Protein CBG10727 [Caenorhabditis briggsae]
MEAVAQIEEADAIIDQRIAELNGRKRNFASEVTFALPSEAEKTTSEDDYLADWFNFLDQLIDEDIGSKTLNALSTRPADSNDFNEYRPDTDNDGREDRGASNHENWDLHGIYDFDPDREDLMPLHTELLNDDESQTSIGNLPAPISSSMMNNEPAISENDPPGTISSNNETTMDHEVPSTESGYESSPSTSSSSNVCNGIGDIEISPFPEVMETEDGEQESSTPARPPRTRDFNSQQDPTVADLSQQVENSLHVPDDLELDSYDKIFSGPLPIPKNRTVGSNSSDHGNDFQHQSWSSTTEAIPSMIDSEYQSSPSTFSPSNVVFPEVMRMEYQVPTSSQYPFYAPAHPSRGNDSKIFDRQHPKQYCDLDKTTSGLLHQVTTEDYFSGTGISEPWSSYYGISLKHQSRPSLTEENPRHSAKRKRWAPYSNNQRPLLERKIRSDGKELSLKDQQKRLSRPVDVFQSISASMQTPMTQDFEQGSCNSNATTFESNADSESQYNVDSPPIQQSGAQKYPPDFFDLGSLHKYVKKNQEYLKQLGGGDTTEEKRIRQRTNVEDKNRREMMDRNCDYSKKCAQNKKDAMNARVLEFIEMVEEVKGIESDERLAVFALELDNYMERGVDNSPIEAYQAQKRQLLSTSVDLETERKVQETWELLNKKRNDFEEKSQKYADTAKTAKNYGEEEKKKATNSAGSAKSRAKEKMEYAELEYDIACLDLIISKTPHLSNLALEFARWCANKIAPQVSWDAKKIMEWVHRNGRTKEWEELKSFNQFE